MTVRVIFKLFSKNQLSYRSGWFIIRWMRVLFNQTFCFKYCQTYSIRCVHTVWRTSRAAKWEAKRTSSFLLVKNLTTSRSKFVKISMLVFGVSDLILIISKNAILLISMPRSSDFSSLDFPSWWRGTFSKNNN